MPPPPFAVRNFLRLLIRLDDFADCTEWYPEGYLV